MRLNKPSDKQKEIFRFIHSKDTYLICDGAVRSGKTLCMTLGFVTWAMLYFNGCDFAICGKTVASAERNIITPYLNIDGVKAHAKYNRAEHCMTISINGRKNRFYVFGGKDESSYQLIQGITLAGVFLDEVALMPRSFVEQAIARCLTYSNKKVWFNCNPENQLHWFNLEWVKKTDSGERDDAQHLHFLMTDNPIIDADAIKQAESMFSGVFYQRYILGLWCMAEGIIYDMFDYTRHVVTGTPDTEGDYFVSCDFGIQNATVWLLWRKRFNSDQWVCVREWYYSGREQHTQLTVDALVNGLREMLGGIEPRQIIIDPSAAALIAELRKNHYHVIQANNDVLDGISDTSTMLKANRLVFCDTCKHTIDEFGLYRWDEKAAMHGDDKPIKENDHCMDAIRYFVKTRHLVKRL